MRTVSVVTISCEFGSGGRGIAARLADRVGWRLVDRELTRAVAERLDVPEGNVAERDERICGASDPISAYLVAGFPGWLLARSPVSGPRPGEVRQVVEAALREAIQGSPAVVVGHGSQCVLRGRPGTLHVRLWSPFQTRVARVAEQLGLDAADAAIRTSYEDARRREYLRRNYGTEIADQTQYDVTLNTARLTGDDAASALAALVRDDRG
jgi:cytidylate kinase